MQSFRVKKPSCKILKTKNCVPFEVPYTSRIMHVNRLIRSVVLDTFRKNVRIVSIQAAKSCPYMLLF